jgi:hypothetical protein
MTRILAALALAALAAPAGAQMLAQTLDTRAASQRLCLEAAQAAGHGVSAIARPVPIMGPLGEVRGETVRLHLGDGRVLTCTYDVRYSEVDSLRF